MNFLPNDLDLSDIIGLELYWHLTFLTLLGLNSTDLDLPDFVGLELCCTVMMDHTYSSTQLQSEINNFSSLPWQLIWTLIIKHHCLLLIIKKNINSMIEAHCYDWLSIGMSFNTYLAMPQYLQMTKGP